ncbi:hypothetical protein [Mucilaginibacter sp.]|uniref:hypothetical protein n=1 Tax=Mucilaginibacter sp. TaxID=1882438 RepID=UPI002615D249|nr:hypothetical protein [Mucilaginibacter sp.]MDB5129209.1 hypothetical protein [Mucilaginibacter sp.]
MKPTEQQLKVLQGYLHKTLNYRETYEEIYDHILSAIEHQPENISFEDAVNNIINGDFGSAKNLLKAERTSKNALVKDCLRKFADYFVGCFKAPSLLYTAGFALAAYYLLSQMRFGAFITECIFAVMFALIIFVPGVIYLMRLYNMGYILGTIKKSAKDRLFETLAGMPLRIFVILTIWVYTPFYKVWQNTNHYSATVLLLFGVIYNVALYKLYRSEFKNAAIAK